ncbi:MAG: aldo/keto reductase [Mycoplasmatales bacterium]|nr:aldo/keto reductase [Mycoplasmatales bacterium]
MINEMPKIALGTWLVRNSKIIDEIIPAALNNGYKHIDTAQIYFNEELIGNTLEKLNIKREDYWITSKVWPLNFKYHTYQSIEKSLERLKTNYIDAMLLHSIENDQNIITAYKELMRAREDGLVRNIGVSNFDVRELKMIKEHTGEYPKYNQIIASVKQRLFEVEDFCKEKGITLMGYSSIRPYYDPNPYYEGGSLNKNEKSIIDEMANKHNVSPAMILQRYVSQNEYVILPKSKNVERVISNFKIDDVALSDEEMKKLNEFVTFDNNDWRVMLKKQKSKNNEQPKDDEKYKIGLRLSKEADEIFKKKYNISVK